MVAVEAIVTGGTASTMLASAVALCFLWSVVLFFAAVFLRERDQEDGFHWALAGAVLFFVVFADRLPVELMWLRDSLTFLPWVSAEAHLFDSSLFALGLLLVVYLFRIALFYELVLREPDGGTFEEKANDKVAPALSYYCFAICLVALLSPLYGMDALGTGLLCLGLVVAYYGGLVTRLLHFFQDFWTELVALWMWIREAAEWVVQHGMLLIAIGEDFRRGVRSQGAGERAEAQRQKIEERRKKAKVRREVVIAKVARGRDEADGSARERSTR